MPPSTWLARASSKLRLTATRLPVGHVNAGVTCCATTSEAPHPSATTIETSDLFISRLQSSRAASRSAVSIRQSNA